MIEKAAELFSPVPKAKNAPSFFLAYLVALLIVNHEFAVLFLGASGGFSQKFKYAYDNVGDFCFFWAPVGLAMILIAFRAVANAVASIIASSIDKKASIKLHEIHGGTYVLNQDVNKLKGELDEMTISEREARLSESGLKEDNKKLSDTNKNLEIKLSNLEINARELEANIKEKEKEVREANYRRDAIAESYNEFKVKKERLKKQIKEAQRDLYDLQTFKFEVEHRLSFWANKVDSRIKLINEVQSFDEELDRILNSKLLPVDNLKEDDKYNYHRSISPPNHRYKEYRFENLD